MQLLSEDAILHISAGFEGPFILQAFSIQHDLYKRGIFNFCVTDGAVYIGARYEFQEDLQLDNYNLIQITAKFEDRFHPITIRTLDIISTTLKKLVGNAPCTLQDYLMHQAKSHGNESTLKKRIKPNEKPSPMPINKEMGVKKAANTPKREPHNSQKQQNKNQSDKKSEIINLDGSDKRLLKLDSSSQEQAIDNSRIDAIFNLDQSESIVKEDSPIKFEKEPEKISQVEKTCFIKDLYERATGWVILCRINYISIVQCSNGLFAANFILVDEEGGQIRCVYFASQIEEARQSLKICNCYLFCGGQVKYSQKQKELHITFDRNSEIIPRKRDAFHSFAKKLIRIDKILDLDHLAIVSVMGVIRKIKTKQHLRSKVKFTATLSDPLKQIQIDFMLFLNNQEKQIKVGMTVVLHNYQIFKQNNIFRLNSTYKSYYYEEKGKQGSTDPISQMCQIVELTDWQNQKFKNISMFDFTHRTIHNFREIYRRTDDQRLFTSLDVWALDITLKTSYYACKSCKRSTQVKQMNLFECLNCKKMVVDTILTHTLCGAFADFTGSCSIDVIGEHAQNLLGMKAAEFHALSADEQNHHLESLKYKNIIIRLKSEKKGEKQRENHSVWGIQKANPDSTLRQIKKQMKINRLKQEQQW